MFNVDTNLSVVVSSGQLTGWEKGGGYLGGTPMKCYPSPDLRQPESVGESGGGNLQLEDKDV